MPHPYSEDLRLRVVNAVESGKTTRQVATLFQVSSSFVSNIHQCWKQSGHVHPKQIGGYRRAFLEPYEDAIKAQLSDHPSMTLKELQSWLESEQGLSISISAIDKFVRQKLGYRYKKNRVRQ
jgi:transposase